MVDELQLAGVTGLKNGSSEAEIRKLLKTPNKQMMNLHDKEVFIEPFYV